MVSSLLHFGILAVAPVAEAPDVANNWLGWGPYLTRGRAVHSVAQVAEPPANRAEGVRAGEIGMAVAIIGTLLIFHTVSYQWV